MSEKRGNGVLEIALAGLRFGAVRACGRADSRLSRVVQDVGTQGKGLGAGLGGSAWARGRFQRRWRRKMAFGWAWAEQAAGCWCLHAALGGNRGHTPRDSRLSLSVGVTREVRERGGVGRSGRGRADGVLRKGVGGERMYVVEIDVVEHLAFDNTGTARVCAEVLDSLP